VRLKLAQPDLGETTNLGRETLLIAAALQDAGAEVHVYQRPGPPRATVVQHWVGTAGVAPPGRLGGALALARWAREATSAIRRERRPGDVVCAIGTAVWEHDLVRVHAVVRAEQQRWPLRGGVRFRAARTRAAVAPIVRPQVAVERGIQRLQFRPGRYATALAVTQEVADDLVRDLKVDPARIEVIACLIDHARFAAVPDRDPGLTPSRKLLFVGNDFGRKGLSPAIRALPETSPDVRLVVVGGGDPVPYQRLARDLGVLDRVEFIGATTTPERFFDDALALVAPTAEDVWGMALIEAMAAGVPVISSDIAGAGSFVEQAGAGIVVDRSDPRGVARAVDRLAGDPSLAASMGAAGRRAAADLHRSTVDALVRAFERTASTGG
jgi:UDP-glucose:(heptosyl)LPS alpha-1,3-glucosyltransferase